MALFDGLDRAYGQYSINKDVQKNADGKLKGKAITVSKPLAVKQWKDHLEGKIGLGVVPVRDDGNCMWAAMDIDVYDLDSNQFVLDHSDWPFIGCRTKSGGLHLYVFFKEPIPASLVRVALVKWAELLGHAGCEIFPKQEELSGPKDFGSWINMPYFDSVLTDRFAIDPETGSSLADEQFLKLAEERKLTKDEFLTFKPPVAEDDHNFLDGPPCLQYLSHLGFPKGSRNHALFSIGVYYRKKYPEDWEERVFQANQRWMEGTLAEVQNIINSLKKRTYTYKCSENPLISHCIKTECQKRPFGIPSAAKTRAEEKKKRRCILDEVDRPVKCYLPPDGSGDEPQWVFRINGQNLDVNIDMVLDQRKFNRQFLIHFQRLVLPVEDHRWERIINDILAEAEVMELPQDAGPEGQFWLHLETFCTGKIQAKDKSELLLGRPWVEEGVQWFRSQDLMKYLDQQRFREYKEKEIWGILRRKEAKHTTFMIKGKCVAVWGVEEFQIQTEDFDKPEIQDKEEF